MPDLTGSIALITGASRGIGFAIAEQLVRSGARVCLTGRSEEDLQAAVERLGGTDHAIAVAGSSDNLDHQDETVRRVTEQFGVPNILVNNAGINPVYGQLLELPGKAARKIVEVNCLAPLSWTQKVVAAGMGEHGGAVINVSSVAGLKPAPGIGFYGATKAMLSYLTMELALELAPRIRVNAVAPAVVKTKFAAALYEGREEQVAATYPLGRLGQPEDIGSAVAFLASAESAWVTGQTLVIDGGITLTGGV